MLKPSIVEHFNISMFVNVGPGFHTWNQPVRAHYLDPRLKSRPTKLKEDLEPTKQLHRSQLTAIRAIPVDVKTSSSSIKDQVGTTKKDEVKEDLLQIRSGPRSPGSLAARGEIRGADDTSVSPESATLDAPPVSLLTKTVASPRRGSPGFTVHGYPSPPLPSSVNFEELLVAPTAETITALLLRLWFSVSVYCQFRLFRRILVSDDMSPSSESFQGTLLYVRIYFVSFASLRGEEKELEDAHGTILVGVMGNLESGMLNSSEIRKMLKPASCDLVAKQVAPYKKVRRVAFISAIPKNPAGKILRQNRRGWQCV
ncbi:unnamed protein product [Microthlaspi erraticum]|uniref:AMP-binding enzyme C-terminal domain-containing protein n=1 Tax=Microthlaspi erraticum TaxID=1685480 RepID=A0A6D2HQX5_9BRAS|nr:unnamed protein product [Microthlaspi erraticum]